MLAPDTCAGLLVSGLQNLQHFFESQEGRTVALAFAVVQFVVIWLWRTRLPEAQELAVGIALLFGAVVFVMITQERVVDPQVVAKCYPPAGHTTSEIANAK